MTRSRSTESEEGDIASGMVTGEDVKDAEGMDKDEKVYKGGGLTDDPYGMGLGCHRWNPPSASASFQVGGFGCQRGNDVYGRVADRYHPLKRKVEDMVEDGWHPSATHPQLTSMSGATGCHPLHGCHPLPPSQRAPTFGVDFCPITALIRMLTQPSQSHNSSSVL